MDFRFIDLSRVRADARQFMQPIEVIRDNTQREK